MANVLPRSKQEMILRAIGVGTPIRHIAHIVGVAEETVSRYAHLAGQMAIDFLDEMQRGLEIAEIEVDEFYGYVAARKHNVDRMKKKVKGAGEQLHFLGVQPKTGFIVNYLVAPSNGLKHTKIYIRDLEARLKRTVDGELAVKLTIFSDGHAPYKRAIEDIFGNAVNYARLTKQQTDVGPDGKKTRKRFDGVVRDVPIGAVEDEEFWTNNVESANRSARAQNRRVARRTIAFSKDYDRHVGHFAFWILYHNYVLPRSNGFYTPAQCAGVAERKWTSGMLVDLIEAYQRKSNEAGLLDAQEEVEIAPAPDDGGLVTLPINAPFWIYHNTIQSTCKIHKADCCNCRHGMGKSGQSTQTGRTGTWYPAQTLDGAMVRAEELEPDDSSICNVCLGSYRKMGRRV